MRRSISIAPGCPLNDTLWRIKGRLHRIVWSTRMSPEAKGRAAKLDFIPSGRNGESGGEAVPRRTRDFDGVGLRIRRREKGEKPEILTDQGQGIDESRQRLRIPGSRVRGQFALTDPLVGGEGHQGKQTQESRRAAGDGEVAPLALGFDAQVSPGFVEGDFELPAQDKPRDDLLGGRA